MKVGVQDRGPTEDSFVARGAEVVYPAAVLDRLLLLGASEETPSLLELVSCATGLPRLGARDMQERTAKVMAWQQQLQRLPRAPGIPQRTPEWYAARQGLVTASDVAQALACSKFGNQRSFFQKKCGAPEEQAAFDVRLPPLKWGVMFEPVAQAIYSVVNAGVEVHEFGLLRHPTIEHVGASPDGITAQGIMLEIKCPWRRKIVPGQVPMQYYHQIQVQLAVCELEECDYFECEFAEVDGPDDEEWRAMAPHERGAFVEDLAGDGDAAPPRFRYPTPTCGGRREDIVAWAQAQAGGAAAAAQATVHWWVMRRQCSTRIVYDEAFTTDVFERLRIVWGAVETYRGDRKRYVEEVGVALPAPARQQQQQSQSGCYDDADSVRMFSSAAGYAFLEEDEEEEAGKTV